MRTEQPQFKARDGVGNYAAGYIGFSMRLNNPISRGIVFFTREEAEQIVVSHTFYVVDEKTIIEAEGAGVQMNDPNKYFNDPYIAVFFKKPVHLSPDYVQKMTAYAFTLVGMKYDYKLALYFIYQWFISKVLKMDISFKKQPPVFDNPDRMLCS